MEKVIEFNFEIQYFLTNKDSNFLEILNNLESELETDFKVPDENDLNGVVQGLTRLQKIYQLNASSVADGHLNGVQYNR